MSSDTAAGASGFRTSDRLGAFILLMALFVPGSIGVSLFDRDEGWYAQITREMLASGDWIVPRYLGETSFLKPAWMFWWSAISVKLLGMNEFALRLPGMLFSAAAWLIVADWTARRWGCAAGWWCAIIAGTSIGANVAGKLLLADGHLLFFVVVAMRCWFERLEAADHSRSAGVSTAVHGPAADDSMQAAPAANTASLVRSGYLFWTAVGFAVLVKGPAVFVVLAPIGAALLLWNDVPVMASAGSTRLAAWWQRLSRAWPGPGWWLAPLIGLPWYFAVMWSDWAEFRTGFIDYYMIDRVSQPVQGHGGPPGYYVAVGLACLWPWSVLAPAVVWLNWSRRRADAASRRLLIWLIAPWVAFELIRTKLPHYVLPIFPPLAMMLARELTRLSADRLADLPTGRAIRAITAVLLAAQGAAALWGASAASEALRASFAAVACASLAGAAWLALCDRRRPAWGLRAAGLALTCLLLYPMLGWWTLPALEPLRLSRSAAAAANRQSAADDTVWAYGFSEPTMFYYLDQPGRELRLGRADWRERAGGSLLVVANAARLDELRGSLALDKSTAAEVSGFNYTTGKWLTLWIGRARVPAASAPADAEIRP